MCKDPEVAAIVQRFYPHVEDVELYVGQAVERGAQGGWALGETAGDALLADAFNSIRQDRFYTDEFGPEKYTDWGYGHAKNTNLTDILNRHLGLGLDRNGMLGRVPDWPGPPAWNKLKGYPFRVHQEGFDSRG